ncbi:magnesium-translocating P-type ATPase [Paenibacillus popilliae]|uniref:Magnesium-transporting ATPase, P-type 1 n=1 Tax=Paenibacillus popilliae TaxID=78057 RepID=A0ABY3AQJ5_PAEPP|nr:magnesium-translocating P-type ATPase [Paenibacillus sp. SDF0028]TQR43371.1 magnesium-translocating P-type ATPase [Paenibacillus sp. SDF0028]
MEMKVNQTKRKWPKYVSRRDADKENARLEQRLIEASESHVDDVLEELKTKPYGLDEMEAMRRLEEYGPNQVAYEKPPAWYIQLLRCFKNPFILVLLGLDVFSALTDDTEAVIIISTMVTISIIITFTQEFRSLRTAEKLKAMVKTTAAVIRGGQSREIDMEQLVPGDMIRLAAGDLIPADIRLLSAKDLLVMESALTGEAMPVEKRDIGVLPEQRRIKAIKKAKQALELDNMAYMGTTVVSGSATAVVIATGSQTYFGAMAHSLVGARPMTSFERGINSVSFVLIRFMLVMVPIIFFINGFSKGDWWDALFFGLSVAVGLTPEMLPVIVTSNLAKGAMAMSRQKVVVKRLNAIQNLGAMNVLCTDKTGTLTQDKIILEKHLNIHGEESEQVLRYAYLNSRYQTGLRNLLDHAVVERAEERGLAGLDLDYTKLDEIPFDFNRRRMSVVLSRKLGEHVLICKGAMEEMLSISDSMLDGKQVVGLEQDMKQQLLRKANEMNEDGLRVIGVAMKVLHDGSSRESYSAADEQGLVFVGYIGFLDPPKDSAAPAIAALLENGVAVKVLTGDNDAVTRKVCRDVGIDTGRIVLGKEIDELSDTALAELADKTTVFAKLNPMQKARIVRALQAKGHTVGFMGDGINDAISLKEADIGISVDTAVDIAKESADIILLEKSLMVLEKGIIEGRRTFGNMIKYIKMTASSNFGNVFSVLGASLFLPFLPMLPLHLLVQNLFYDVSQLSIPWDNMDKEFLKKPRTWDAKSIGRFMLFIGPTSSIFDFLTYGLMMFVFAANSPADQALFHSGWFIEGLLSQTLIVHMIRTEKVPFIQSRASLPVMLLTGLIMLAGIMIPFSEFGEGIGLVPLPLSYFPWLAAILLGYCILTQSVKKWYIRRFNDWL